MHRKSLFVTVAALLFSTILLAYSNGQWGPSWYAGTAAGYEPNQTLYVCKTNAHGGIHPGKVVDGTCHIGYAGREEIYSDYAVYTGPGQWQHKNSDFWWGGAVLGGYESGRDLVVCLAAAHGGFHPGKIVEGFCNIGYGGVEELHNDYYVLVE